MIFPLDFVEIISGDSNQVYRETISLEETKAFGENDFNFSTNLQGRKWLGLRFGMQLSMAHLLNLFGLNKVPKITFQPGDSWKQLVKLQTLKTALQSQLFPEMSGFFL